MRALNIGASGMEAQQLNVEVISHNIANLSTTGFKRVRAEFQDMLYENIRRVGSASADDGSILPTGLQVGLGVKPVATYRINEQGELSQTENDYDMAISGKGYFQIDLPDGSTGYTRDGSFQLDADGQIVTADGYPLTPAITIPDDAETVTISSSGIVTVSTTGESTVTNLGTVQLARFINPAGLNAIGDNMYLETESSGAPVTGDPATDSFGKIYQGYVESSNVDVVTELTNMIEAQRAYEMNSRVIKTADDMLSTVSQVL